MATPIIELTLQDPCVCWTIKLKSFITTICQANQVEYRGFYVVKHWDNEEIQREMKEL